MNIDSTVRLNNGVRMPRLGLGTYQMRPGKETFQAVLWALEAGYRLIDTASYYGNEKDVGEAVRASGIPREEIFLTTKLQNHDQGFEQALQACETSRRKLGVDQIDLYLLHWPVPQKRKESWLALERLLHQGSCRAIGVSNYLERHLDEMSTYAQTVPSMDQVEFSPFLHQRTLLQSCQRQGIVLQAYSPLTRGRRFDHPGLVVMAEHYHKTVAQVLLRWCLQKGVPIIPKSVQRERIIENAAVFDFQLSEHDILVMDGWNEDLHVSWDPSGIS